MVAGMSESIDLKLDDWRGRLEPMLDGLQDFILGPDEPMDLSAESLHGLENLLLAETPLGQPPHEGLAESIGGYLGEVLLTIGGGAWTWDLASDLPVAALGVDETVEPMRLVLDAVVQRTGTVWSAEYGRIQALAAAHRNDDPDWEPTRADRPALRTELPSAAPQDPWLVRWLAAREQQFPGWSESTGRADELDFSPKSLLPLEEIVRDRIPSKAALRESADNDFVQGAIWYVGEVARRHGDAHWTYTPDSTGTSKNPHVGRPFVEHDDEGGGSAIPLLELEASVLSDEDGVLLTRFEDQFD